MNNPVPMDLLMKPIGSGLDPSLDQLQGRLKTLSAETASPRLKEVTQEFEALFLSYLLKVMRSTVQSSEPESSSLGKDVYMGMFDNEIALSIARTQSLGIGEMLFRQLQSGSPPGQQSGEVAVQPDLDRASPEVPAVLEKPMAPVLYPGQRISTPLPPGSLSRSREKLAAPPGLAVPVEGVLTSSYGPRVDPLTHQTRMHRGIDIAAPSGTPIQAVGSGMVIFSGFLREYGNTVIIQHPNGYRTLYAHASQALVRAGETVGTHQVIGTVGSTGRSTGSHLHFELQKSGQHIDPELLLAEEM